MIFNKVIITCLKDNHINNKHVLYEIMFIVLVSYRARGVQSFRRNQLEKTIQNFKTFFEKNKIEYRVVIAEQNNDKKFNRGLLLNVAFLESEKSFTFPKKYIHMNADYNFNLSHKFPKEIMEFHTGFMELFRVNAPVLGSACVFDGESYKKTNGFPNDIEGWGGDDWAILHRIQQNDIPLSSPEGLLNNNFIIEEEIPFQNDQSHNRNNIALAKRNDFTSNGLNSIDYNIDGFGEFHDGNDIFHYLIN